MTVSFSFAQTTNAPSATNETVVAESPATETNLADQAQLEVLQLLSDKLIKLEAEAAAKQKEKAEQAVRQMTEMQARIEAMRKEDNARQSTLTTVLIVVASLAVVSILSLVAFCFYAVSRFTARNSPPSTDPMHPYGFHALPQAPPMHSLPYQTPPMENPDSRAVTQAGANRLMDAVDRLE